MKSNRKPVKNMKMDCEINKHPHMKYKLFFLLVSMFFMLPESKSQTECLHYPYNTQIGMNLNINMLSKMRIEPNYYYSSSSSEYFTSYPSLGGNFGVYLYQRIYKWFGMQIGVEYNAATIAYRAMDDLFDNSLNMDYYTWGAFTLPISFNASYYFKGKHGIDISLGGEAFILFVEEAGYGIGFGGNRESAHIKFRLSNDARCNYSLIAKIGYNYLFKNKNTFGVAIIGSYSADSYVKGKYEVEKNGILVEEGYTSLRNSFIGLQFSFGFTMKKLLCSERQKKIE
jgi:hypothetical protein